MTSPASLFFAETPLPPPVVPTWHAERALTVVEEMLERLETVTLAGRQHLTAKIVTVLTAHAQSIGVGAGGPLVARRVEELRGEANKIVPDGRAFCGAAHAVIAAMKRAGGRRGE